MALAKSSTVIQACMSATNPRPGSALPDEELLIHDSRVIAAYRATTPSQVFAVHLADVLDIAIEVAEVVITADLLKA